ncbi:MAG TPA: hypothetical protein VKB52_03070 [Rhodanobacteraceae bacterium]|nr:hypothetical protein [Rhodanobacteraceae bacterium]
MKNSKMLVRALAIALLAATTAGLATSAVAAQKAHAAKKPAEPPKPQGQVVEYAELESRVGQTLVIETTFKTTRQGKLIKYTQPTLTLDIGAEGHPTEFTVPKETIRTITVLTPADPAATPAAEPPKDAGKSGAKKN